MVENDKQKSADERRKRIERLKKLIVFVRRAGYIVPWLVVIGLCAFIACLKAEIRESNKIILEYGEENERLNFEIGKMDEEARKRLESASVVTGIDDFDDLQITDNTQPLEDLTLSDEQLYDGYRKVYLTFDDGPGSNTDEILDILAKYNVKATFFVIYKEGLENEQLYRRIVDEGHSLGMHSCTHEYSVVYESPEAFLQDTQKLRNFLYMVTGKEISLYRFPGGSSNKVSRVDMKTFAKCLHDEGIEYFDWNISSQDASNPILSKSRIVSNVVSHISEYSEAVVLMHDTAGKVTTVEALPEIIETIQAMDKTVLLPITDETKPIQHRTVD